MQILVTATAREIWGLFHACLLKIVNKKFTTVGNKESFNHKKGKGKHAESGKAIAYVLGTNTDLLMWQSSCSGKGIVFPADLHSNVEIKPKNGCTVCKYEAVVW